MADIITSGLFLITPTVVLGYGSAREAGTIVHPIINRAAPDVTLRPARLRSGDALELGFSSATSEADSKTAEEILSMPAVFTLSSADRTTVVMSFVVRGTVKRTLEDVTRNAWVVSFGWQEVTA